MITTNKNPGKIKESELWVTIECSQCKQVYPLGWEMTTFSSKYWITIAGNGTAHPDYGKFKQVVEVGERQLSGLGSCCST